MKTILAALLGATVATTLILACSDDSPGRADAAACDCPAAEPPVPNRLMTVRGLDSPLAANSYGGAFATCPTGSTLVTGHCYIVNEPGTPPAAAIRQFGVDELDPLVWSCGWDNFNGGSALVHAEAVCLVPAS